MFNEDISSRNVVWGFICEALNLLSNLVSNKDISSCNVDCLCLIEALNLLTNDIHFLNSSKCIQILYLVIIQCERKLYEMHRATQVLISNM